MTKKLSFRGYQHGGTGREFCVAKLATNCPQKGRNGGSHPKPYDEGNAGTGQTLSEN